MDMILRWPILTGYVVRWGLCCRTMCCLIAVLLIISHWLIWYVRRKVIYAAKLAGAHDFISELREGYNTIVGEQGAGLSGGQRQRIAIARALVNNPKILIFDEATSALDYESEHIIMRNMHKICKGRTVIIIAHRLSTVKNADRIIVMEKGKIVEQGKHKELLSEPESLYSYLYQLQSD